MNFLGGLLGGKGGDKDLVDKIVAELEGTGVSDATWSTCQASDGLEDGLEDELPRDRLAVVLEKHPQNCLQLASRCVVAVESALGKDGDAFDDDVEGKLVNSCLLLCKLLSATPAGTRIVGTREPEELPCSTEFSRLLWEAPTCEGAADAQRPLGHRAVDAAMRALFHEGFTVDGKDEEESGQPALVSGVSPTLIWADGVGPEREESSKPDEDTRSNRQLVLQLLAALLCGGAPAAAAAQFAADEADGEGATVHGSGADLSTVAEGSAKTASEVDLASRRLFVADVRPLAYLSEPDQPVPFRSELLYSLLSVALSYDPHGYGVPYAGYILGQKDEEFATVCLQVLGLLLMNCADTEVSGAVVQRRPQEEVAKALQQIASGQCSRERASAQSGAPPVAGRSIFRQLLRGISSESEVSFLVNGVMTLLGTISEERSTYLPSSMRLPPFLPEVMVLVFHLTTCDAFVAAACAQGEAPALVEGLLHVAARQPDHLREDTLALLVGITLMRLTAYREVCAALNEDFAGDVPDNLPEFKGSGADLVILAALKQASDHFAASAEKEVSECAVEVYLCALSNVSAFAEGLSMETCFRLFALLERCVKSAHVKRERRHGAIWLPHLLEAVENIVQYQYGSNASLVYGLMTRQGMLKELAALTEDLVRLSEGAGVKDGERSPAISAEGSGPELAAWWRGVASPLTLLLEMLEAVVPAVEREVEKRDTTTPDEVKALLPGSVLGLLPMPRPFVLRTLRDSEFSHLACEHCLLGCLADGPCGALWEEDDDGEDGSKPKKAGASKKGERPAKLAPSAERGASRTRHSKPLSARKPSPPTTGGRNNPPPKSLQEQLEAAAASGVDVLALMKQLQVQQAKHPAEQ